MKNSLHGFAHMTPPGHVCLRHSCFSSSRKGVSRKTFLSFHSPHIEQVFAWLGGQRMHNESKSRADHRQLADCGLSSPSCVRATPSSICSLSLHQSDSLRWQDQEERECGPAAALIRGNLFGVQNAAALPCPALPCHFSHIKSSSLLFHFTLVHVCGRWESGGKARGKPWVSLSD